MDEIQKFLFDHLDNNGEIHLNHDKSAILLTGFRNAQKNNFPILKKNSEGISFFSLNIERIRHFLHLNTKSSGKVEK